MHGRTCLHSWTLGVAWLEMVRCSERTVCGTGKAEQKSYAEFYLELSCSRRGFLWFSVVCGESSVTTWRHACAAVRACILGHWASLGCGQSVPFVEHVKQK